MDSTQPEVSMGLVAASAIVSGIVLVVVAWTKRDEKWASSLFWMGVTLLLVPIGWEFAEGFLHGVTEVPR
jgi:high-affinity Fe2+/Pb2+ permease